MLYYEGEKDSVYDPIVLTTFEAFDRHMKKKLPDIYKSSSSIINMVRMINLTFHDGDMVWFQLPSERDALWQLVGYLRENTERGALDRFMDELKEREPNYYLLFRSHLREFIPHP